MLTSFDSMRLWLYLLSGHSSKTAVLGAQIRQSAMLVFLQPSELGLPHPLSRRRVCPPFGSGGGGGAHSLAGVGIVPIPTRGQTLKYSRCLCTLWLGGTSSGNCWIKMKGRKKRGGRRKKTRRGERMRRGRAGSSSACVGWQEKVRVLMDTLSPFFS